jgi:hypothetical protein
VSGKNNKNEWVTLWEEKEIIVKENKARINKIKLENPNSIFFKEFRLDIDCMNNVIFYEIDAIKLIGFYFF